MKGFNYKGGCGILEHTRIEVFQRRAGYVLYNATSYMTIAVCHDHSDLTVIPVLMGFTFGISKLHLTLDIPKLSPSCQH